MSSQTASVLLSAVKDVSRLRRTLIAARRAAALRQDEVGSRRTVGRFEAECTSMDIHGLALYARRVGLRLTLVPLSENAPDVAHSRDGQHATHSEEP
jgi:hypothetical protein